MLQQRKIINVTEAPQVNRIVAEQNGGILAILATITLSDAMYMTFKLLVGLFFIVGLAFAFWV